MSAPSCRSRSGLAASLILAAAAVAVPLPAAAAVIAQWNFNGPLTGTLLPSVGAGTLRAVGVGSSGFGSGAANGGSSDPVSGSPPNFGWQVWGFPAQGSGALGAGIQGAVDTTGFSAITLAFDLRASGSSARHQQLQYALDGVSFIDFGAPAAAGAADSWVNQRTFDLGAIADAGDNPLFAFRLVSAFAPGSGGYQATASGSNYSAQGTWRFDMLTVSGSALAAAPADPGPGLATIPLPASAPLLIAGLLLLGRFSRRAR